MVLVEEGRELEVSIRTLPEESQSASPHPQNGSLHHVRVREREENHPNRGGQGLEILRRFDRGIVEARYGLRVYVVDRAFETTLEEAPAHRLPHVSQPDEAYLLHATVVVSS